MQDFLSKKVDREGWSDGFIARQDGANHLP